MTRESKPIVSASAKIGAVLACGAALAWLAVEHRSPPPKSAPVADARPVAAAEALDAEPSASARATAAEPAPVRPERVASAPPDGRVPPGIIEGLVLRGSTPVDGGTVYFWPGSQRALPRSPADTLQNAAPTELARRAIDGEGRFAIAPLATGAYTLAVDVGNGPTLETSVDLTEARPSERVVIVLGSSRVFGHVYDAQGRPVADAAVRIGIEAGGRAFKSRAFTDAHGAYDVRDLPAGSHWLVVNREGDPNGWAALDVMRRLTPLTEGETRRVDVGSPERSAVWRGNLRTRGGELTTRAYTIGVTHTSTNSFTELHFEAGAPFELALEPGTYRVSVTLSGGSQLGIPMPDVLVGGQDFDADLVLPGARVRGTVIGWTANVPGERYPRRLEIAIRPRGETHGIRTVDVADDGSFVFDAVPAGAWTVTTHPFDLAPGSAAEVIVSDGDVEVPLSISVSAVIR